MVVVEVLLLCFNLQYVITNKYSKPIALTKWPDKCSKNSYVLNDCNWCRCDSSHKYTCNARVCNEVDMFGHFNDAIRDINVGMEGKGSWRSKLTSCEPGVQYKREGLLCVCGEEGTWPNPVCRDTFRVLHPVDISKKQHHASSDKCEATKLYLIGCNVCFCPSTERLDPNLCTTKNCSIEDPVLHDEPNKNVERSKDDERSLEIYAECELDRKYKFGCRNCMCLRNNRLLCDECSSDDVPKQSSYVETYCDNVKPGEVFNMDCNLCFCDKKNLLYCTTKLCLGYSKSSDFPQVKEENLILVDKPYDEIDCVPGTTYEKECNTCYCTQTEYGEKYYTCTKKRCNLKNSLDILKKDCVQDMVYEVNCQICRCNVVRGVKREVCHVDSKCTGMKAMKQPRSLDINSMYGYCEPHHTYQKDCNTCRCLSDGKILMCTPNVCDRKPKQPIAVDIVPVEQSGGGPCPQNHMYKVDCNICFCLSNGNVLCSTADCNKEN